MPSQIEISQDFFLFFDFTCNSPTISQSMSVKKKKRNMWNEGIQESNASDLVPMGYELVLG